MRSTSLAGGAGAAALARWRAHARRLWGAVTLAPLRAARRCSPRCRSSGRSSPTDAWVEANRTLAYLAVFAAGVALVRARARSAGPRCSAASSLASVDRLRLRAADKVFPGALNPDEIYARLREPFGYWNAVGLMAALGVPGVPVARRPPLGPRGAQRARLPGARRCCRRRCCWPTRAARCSRWRSAARSGSRSCRCACAASRSWPERARRRRSSRCGPSRQDALSKDHVPLGRARRRRPRARHRCSSRWSWCCSPSAWRSASPARQRAPSLDARRQAGVAVLVALALVPVARRRRARAVRARPGRHDLQRLEATSPTRTRRDAANDPDRLTAVGSVRARYWNEALKISGPPGARRRRRRLRDRPPALPQRHARRAPRPRLRRADAGRPRARRAGASRSRCSPRGWRRAARTTGLRRRDRGARRATPERVGMLTLLAIVRRLRRALLRRLDLVRPGNAVARAAVRRLARRPRAATAEPSAAARAAARWRCASRGAIGLARGRRRASRVRRPPGRRGSPCARVAAGSDALGTAEAGDFARRARRSRSAAHATRSSVDPLFEQAAIETRRRQRGRRAPRCSGRCACSPPTRRPWLRLAEFELDQGRKPQAPRPWARRCYLDPRSQEADHHLPAGQRPSSELGRARAGWPLLGRAGGPRLAPPRRSASTVKESTFQDDDTAGQRRRPTQQDAHTRHPAGPRRRPRTGDAAVAARRTRRTAEARKPDDFDAPIPPPTPRSLGPLRPAV